MSRPQFAFLIEKLSTRAEGVHFIAKWRITVFFTNRVGLIYLAIYPTSIITASVRPLSASMDFFNFSETRACSWLNKLAQHNQRKKRLLNGYSPFCNEMYTICSRRQFLYQKGKLGPAHTQTRTRGGNTGACQFSIRVAHLGPVGSLPRSVLVGNAAAVVHSGA